MSTLGQAYVQIMPSAKGISGSIQKTINPEATAAGKSAGKNIASSIASSMSRAGSTLTKAITVPAMGAATAIGGIVAAFGWKRLVAVDAAQAQLKGLGYSAEDVSRISDGLRDAISGGMLTMAEATSAAATAMAAGVKEGDELTRYIQLLDSAVVGGTGTFTEMEQIFGRVVDQGKLTRTEFDMIAQRMPGFSSAVQKSMGVGSEAMYEMLRNGEITTDDFLDVMEDFAGGMADAYADSWSGMVQNTLANVGIIGETILGGVFEQSKESIAEFLDYLRSDDLKVWAQEAGQVIGDAFNGIIEVVKGAIEWWTNLDGSTQKMIMTIAGIAVAIGPVLLVASKLITTFMTIQGIFMKLMTPIALVIKALGGIASPVLIVIGVITGLIALFTTLYQSNEGFRDLVQTVWATIQETISTVIQTISDFVMEIWGGLVEWWNVNGEMIRQAAENVWNFISTLISTVMNVIWAIMQALWPVIQALIISTWEAIKGAIQGAIDVITGIIQFFSALFTGNWSALWDSVKQIVSGAVQLVWNLVQLWFVGKILKLGNTLFTGLRGIVTNIWNTVKSLFTGGVNTARNVVSTGFNFIRNIISSVMNAIRGVISNIWNGIRNTISNVVNGIRSTISNIFNSLRGIVSSAFNGVRSAVTNGMRNAFNAVKNFFGRFKDAGKKIVTSIADGIKGAVGKVTDAIGNVTQKVRDFLPFSPPKTGPLMDIMDVEWGETIGGGIEKGENVVQKAMNDLLTFDPPHRSATHAGNLDDSQDIAGLLTELINAVRENRDVYIDGEKATGRINEVNAIQATIGGYMG